MKKRLFDSVLTRSDCGTDNVYRISAIHQFNPSMTASHSPPIIP